jgi:hypothetical protein
LKRVVQVLAARAVERFTVPGQVPRSPSDITPEWLTGVLCAERPSARVIAVTPTGGSTGTTSRQALEVSYNELGEGLPTRLFVKCTTTAGQRLMLGLGGMIDGEPQFYNHVRPRLDIEAPIGYYGAVDNRSWRSVVVMEDVVATRGSRFWRPLSSLARRQIEDLLTNVAKWHGAMWQSDLLGEWTWLRTPAEQMTVIDSLIGLADRIPAGLERARAVIPHTLHRRNRDLREAMRRSMRVTSETPHTYLHGDLHIANTYVTAGGSVGVADWHAGLKGSWAFDFAYLLATALEVEERRSAEHDLLDFYLEQLAASGGGPVAKPEAWKAYRRATFYPYFAWLYTLGRSWLQPRFQPADVSLMLIERIAAAIDDLDSFAAIGL